MTRASDSYMTAMNNANADLPLYFDGMLFYLRVQADAYAKLVPDFYQCGDAKQVPRRSFRDQMNWFIHPDRSSFDPTYTSILQQNCAWFDRLAGKNEKGLRDVLVHKSGISHVGGTQKSVDAPFELHADYTKMTDPQKKICTVRFMK